MVRLNKFGFPLLGLIMMVMIHTDFCTAQENVKNADLLDTPLRVYLDGDYRDRTYMVREMPFVDFTRDPNLAQVHVLVSVQHTGSGGHKFTLDYIGRETFSEQDQQLFFVSEQSDTDEMLLRGLARVMKMGLLRYVSQTRISKQIDIGYDEEEGQSFEERTFDPWNYWVFQFDVGGSFGWEESQNDMQFSGSTSARRITNGWRIENSISYR
jgi:hypothetical protein